MRDKEDLPPIRASHLLNKLTSLIGNANTELRLAEMAYKRELMACLGEYAKANRARMHADTSPEYERYLEARHAKEEIIESVRSLKSYLRCLEEELRLSGR